MRHYRVAIGVATGENWKSDMGLSLVAMTAFYAQQPLMDAGRQEFCVAASEGSILPQQRQRILDKAVAQDCTHLLFVDTDQSFPHYTLHQLLSHNRPVVACNIATKKFPSGPTARRKSDTLPGGDVVYSDEKAEGLERVWRVGTGIMLVDLFYLQRIPKPHFMISWRPEVQDFEGEDWYFCTQLEKYDVPIYVDHDLSKQIGHVGKFTYTHDLVTKPEVPG